MLSSLRSLIAVLLAFSGMVLAQTPPPFRAALDFESIPRPPVPADVLELVPVAAQPVQDVQQRIEAITLLNKARDLSNVRAQPYHLKTSFSSSGGLASDGTWMLEDISSGRRYRWTAQGPNYSAIHLYPEAGQTVVEARTISVTDPPDSRDAMFNPAGLTALGIGRAMNPGLNLPMFVRGPRGPYPTSNADAVIQVVVLHGNVGGDGRFSEAGILASSDATLNQEALDRAKDLAQARSQSQPGATAQSREWILTYEFVTRRR